MPQCISQVTWRCLQGRKRRPSARRELQKLRQLTRGLRMTRKRKKRKMTKMRMKMERKKSNKTREKMKKMRERKRNKTRKRKRKLQILLFQSVVSLRKWRSWKILWLRRSRQKATRSYHQENLRSFLRLPLTASLSAASSSSFSRMSCPRPQRTSEHFAQERRAGAAVGSLCISRTPSSIGSFRASCVKVVTLREVMALVVSPSTAQHFEMKTLSSSTLAGVVSPWRMLGQIQTDLSSSFAQVTLLTSTESMLYLESWSAA
mmetsp:Transcript_59324/g.105459  ORF Transcript_59324/g.105459 Transcript_59324/m.105459 type:complete len:261 (+) Transcript_59324:271-1053(+)